jgi:hypothetical protein
MPVYAEWDDEAQTTIRIHIHDPWEISEYIQASGHTHLLMASVTYPVHLIVDLSIITSSPKALADILLDKNLATLDSHILPNQGLVIGVKYSPYLRAVTKTVARKYPRLNLNMHYVHTLAEAREYITKHGPSFSSES